jgi:hypothetical protein|tara:strand:- start:642 stop:1307 length:666 start_codon:yes stop_codon:yes gene_type:complete
MQHQLNLKSNRKRFQNDAAFVLGNGNSRLAINCPSLVNKGTVYGCNAQYREFDPHFLIAVDVKMVNELIDADYHKKGTVWTNPNKGIKAKSNINLFSPHKGWSSGPTALWFAASNGHKNVYIIGFDYAGLKGKFNNVYADTFNYKKSSDAATFFGNWLGQTEKVIKEFRHTKFFRVVEDGGFIPDKLGPQHGNLTSISKEEFENTFPESIYQSQTNQKTTI